MFDNRNKLSFNNSMSDNFYKNGEYRRPQKWLLRLRANLYLNQILHLVQIGSDYHILEVGCDSGQLTELLKKRTHSVVGIDINPISVNNSGKDYLRVMDAQELGFSDCSFNLVVSTHTIEHLPNVQKALCEFERVLRPGGFLILIYPWEPIRGYTVLPEALLYYRSIKKCRQIHLHNFTPREIDHLLIGSSLVQRNWRIFFVPHPNFISVLHRNGTIL
jgi:arsenite methyltransferase